MRRRRVGLRVVGVLACAGLVTFAAYYERPAASSRTEENPVCTRSNNGSSCQRRVCTRVVCYTGEESCSPTEWECGPWKSGTCRPGPFGLWHYCAVDEQ